MRSRPLSINSRLLSSRGRGTLLLSLYGTTVFHLAIILTSVAVLRNAILAMKLCTEEVFKLFRSNKISFFFFYSVCAYQSERYSRMGFIAVLDDDESLKCYVKFSVGLILLMRNFCLKRDDSLEEVNLF